MRWIYTRKSAYSMYDMSSLSVNSFDCGRDSVGLSTRYSWAYACTLILHESKRYSVCTYVHRIVSYLRIYWIYAHMSSYNVCYTSDFSVKSPTFHVVRLVQG